MEDSVDGLAKDAVLAELGKILGEIRLERLVEFDSARLNGDAFKDELGRLAKEG